MQTKDNISSTQRKLQYNNDVAMQDNVTPFELFGFKKQQQP